MFFFLYLEVFDQSFWAYLALLVSYLLECKISWSLVYVFPVFVYYGPLYVLVYMCISCNIETNDKENVLLCLYNKPFHFSFAIYQH